MPTRRRERFIHGVLAWMLVSLLGLTLLSAYSHELFFVLNLIGFLVVTELTAPFTITPAWRRRVQLVIVLGLAVFGYIVIKRIIEILPPGVI